MKVFKLEARDYIDPESGEPKQSVQMVDGGATPKCGGCNWEVSYVFVAADSQEEAEEMYRTGHAGLCGDCFSEMLEEISAQVISPKLRAVSDAPKPS